MLYLVESTNNGDLSSLISAETSRVAELLTSGTIVHCWLKSDASGAVMVLDCADADEVGDVLGTFPSAVHGLTDFEVTAIKGLDADA